MLDVTTYAVVLRLEEDLLGTCPKAKAVYSDFIAAKAAAHLERERKRAEKEGDDPRFSDGKPATDNVLAERVAEEVDTIPELEDKGWTGFHEDNDGPFLFDYALKGFLCEAARTLKERGTVKQLQDKFKRYVFVKPRRVRLPRPGRVEDFAGKPMLVVTPAGIVCERPLRAQTAQGPRVTVVRSDVVLAGAELTFTLDVLRGGGITKPIIHDVLSYGQYQGLGQWRSSGMGRFSLSSLEEA